MVYGRAWTDSFITTRGANLGIMSTLSKNSVTPWLVAAAFTSQRDTVPDRPSCVKEGSAVSGASIVIHSSESSTSTTVQPVPNREESYEANAWQGS